MDDNNDIEVIDVENYKNGGEQRFSHQVLVMKAVYRCIDSGGKEMRQGYYNERTDKNGNKIFVYVPDTRKDFIESVESLQMLMQRDYDADAIANIKIIEGELQEEYKKLCLYEKIEWNNLTVTTKRRRWASGIFQIPNGLNVKAPYYQEYIEFHVRTCRKIFAEILSLVKRMNDYEEVFYSNAAL